MEILGLIDLPRWLLTIVFFILTVCLYTLWKQSYFQRHGIPTRKTLFLFGDIREIAKKGFAYLTVEDHKKYGKIFGTYLGNHPSLLISDPDILREINVKQFQIFTDRADMFKMEDKWKTALSLAQGDNWRFIRHTLSPTFTSGKLRNMGSYVHHCVEILHGILDKNISEHPDGFDLAPIIRMFALDVIARAGFGVDINAQTDPDSAFPRHLRRMTEFNGGTDPRFLVMMFFPDLVRLCPWLIPNLKFVPDDSWDFIKDATEQIFNDRKQEQTKHNDMLQLLVDAHKDQNGDKGHAGDKAQEKRALTDTEILINSIVFLMAGLDTTSTAINWLMYELAINTDIQDKLIDVIDSEIGDTMPTYEKVFNTKYLEMVVNECLRMHPPAPRINRQACQDIEIKGLKIPKGLDVGYSTLILHFLPEYWEEPERFNPERFSPENVSKINEYAYLPFGVGPRNCIGMRLALLEVKTALVSLLQNYRIHRTEQLTVPMPVKAGSLASPGKPVFLRLERRNKAEQ